MSQEPVNGLIPTPPQKEAWENWGDGYSGKKVSSRLEVWNPGTLQWERMTQPGGGGGGGGPVTVADGADVAEGATTDAAVVTDANGTVSGKLRGLVKWAFERMPASLGQKTMAASLPVVLPSDQALWPATQPVSAAALPLPAGAATSAAQTDGSQLAQARGKLWTGAAWVDAPGDATNGQKVQIAASIALPVTGTFWQATQPVSGTFWQATQPVSGTVTGNQGTGAAAGTSYRVKGDQARASATIADPVITGGRAANYPTKPASVAAGQVVDVVTDLEGVTYIRPRQVATYVAMYRLALAAASSKLTFTFVANTDKQLATLYHAATATKRVTIRRVWVQIISTGAVAGEVQLELRTLSAATAPATGNPAITPAKRDQAAAAAEATALALPTMAGSEVAANSPISSWIGNFVASMQTVFTTGTVIPADLATVKLYDEASADDEEVAPIMRAGVAEGYAVIGRSTAAVPLNFIIRIVFTEE